MRPILVLVLVLIAIGALLFGVYTLIGRQPEKGHVGPTAAVQQPAPDAPSQPAALAGGGTQQDAGRAPQAQADRQAAREVADRGNLLTGSVVTPDGQPLADAQVTLTTQGTDELTFVNDPVDHSKDMVARTDRQGRYRFQDVPPRDRYKIVAEHPDYARTSMLSNPIQEVGEFLEPPLAMQVGAQLTGYVQDTGGNAVPDATLNLDGMFVLEDGETADRMTERTDAEGFYKFKNVPQSNSENRTLSVQAQGYASQTQQGLIFRVDEAMMTRDFTLLPALMLQGRVLGPDGAGLPRTRVVAVGTQAQQRGMQSKAVTDEQGNFLFEDLAPGQYMLQARKPGYRYKSVPRVEAGESNVIIEMLEEGKVSGRLVDAATNLPVTSFQARLRFYYQEDVPTAPSEIQDTFSNAKGEFTLTGVKPGEYLAEGRADGYAPSFSLPFRVTQSQDIAGIEVRMTKGGVVKGRVVDSAGDPIAGARVRTEDNEYVDDLFQRALGDAFPSNATQRETRTDKDGRFVIAELHAANYQVIVNAVGFTELSVPEIAVTEGAEHDLGSLKLMGGGTLQGTLFDGGGHPIVAGMVRLEPSFVEEGLPYKRYETKSGADGKFRIPNIYPGQYRMMATRLSSNNANPLETLLDAKNSEISVSIGNDETVTQDITISE
jgi:Carboxypeptidase regulatory-like domain